MASIAVCREKELITVSSAQMTLDEHDEARKASLTFSRSKHTDLPLPDVLHPLSKGSLQAGAKLQSVAAYFDDVVDKSAHGRQGKGR